MEKCSILNGLFYLLAVTALIFLTTGCGKKQMAEQEEIKALRAQVKALLAEKQFTEEYLMIFDTLDYVALSEQKWERFSESHAENIKVNWPDGHSTVGLEQHIEDIKKMFVYAPDARIKEHPIRFGSGKYTAVIGYREGTFTKPMPVGDGKFIQPTGKSFRIPMCTIGIWEDGVMVEEYLFVDNMAYFKQMGIIE